MSSQNQELTAPLKAEEGPQVYHPGGFHPVHLGEVYDGKHKVLRKLGFERYSTGVMRDQKNISEREILEHLRAADPLHPGYAYISTLVDSFEHHGLNGRHICLVFRVIGEKLPNLV
ncbi:hypothetical protein EMCG_03368 [[Emmonsia] crescens]|uniref:non-specific serine/threonine protein kinase n=1 Tax=[Emmonsia] crescens TaxID=73230 RepID=A0A0G2HWG4_9EURO|nr:hypothetical protein EMCG_03368 [Emmonsia crescens UAMH 3008]